MRSGSTTCWPAAAAPAAGSWRGPHEEAALRGSPGRAEARAAGPQVLVITGLSGSGKTLVSRALEDAGWFCVDNLPTALIPRFAELLRGSPALRRSVLVVDIREHEFLRRFPKTYRSLKEKGLAVSLIFLESDEKVLVRRFSETRRPHPLAVNQPVIDGIREEREALRPIRKMADLILDTSAYTVHELRDYIREHYDLRASGSLVVSLLSFGYKFGVPSDADLVIDVRFLPNPNFVASLKKLTGQHPAVVRFMQRQPDTAPFLRRLAGFLRYVIPLYVREGKSYLTIAIGCTGGRHRSVMIATALKQLLRGRNYVVKVRHRDVRVA